jgi:hypothetical protein
MIRFDRKKYFDSVRASLFYGSMTDDQVDGQEAILLGWELLQLRGMNTDLRWLAYALATTIHETASTMQPIEEYGQGAGQPYGVPDPETKQTYYGRGFVQLTWRDNYARATRELELADENDLEWHAHRALELIIAAAVMFRGMSEGWFRTGNDGKPQTFARYFDSESDDPYGAREIINGDKHIVPDWSGGVSIGKLIENYHDHFLEALEASKIETEAA